MKGLFVAGLAGLATSVMAATVPVDPIVVNGKHFFYKTNQTEFFVRGVAYQQDYDSQTQNVTGASGSSDIVDPLADVSACQRDIPYLLKIRTNVLRTYAIDPTADHSGCMNAFAAAGIYVISDLSQPLISINRDDPSWDTDLYAHYTSVIDNLSQYTNLLGFFAGNEVSNSENTTAASAFVKAAVRDSKAYIAANVDRPIYVGYATYDGDIRDQLIEFFNCGDQTDAIDFWGYNVYSWCGNSNYVASNYQARTEFLQPVNIPAIFAEYGCNVEGNQIIVRPFTEVQALFGTNMTPVWSGGIVYSYFQTDNGFGLVNVTSNSVTTGQDFDNLSSQMAKASPATTAYSAVNTGTPFSCPTVDATWSAIATPLPPTPNAQLCECVPQAVACVVNNSTDPTGYGDLFNFVCGQSPDSCDGIAKNGTTGTYGAYGMCDSEVQLDFVLNQYYLSERDSVSTACDFGGSASLQSASVASTCSSLIKAAGTNGASTLPGGTPTGTANTNTGTSGNAAVGRNTAIIDHGYMYLGLFLAGALVTGTGAFVL